LRGGGRGRGRGRKEERKKGRKEERKKERKTKLLDPGCSSRCGGPERYPTYRCIRGPRICTLGTVGMAPKCVSSPATSSPSKNVCRRMDVDNTVRDLEGPGQAEHVPESRAARRPFPDGPIRTRPARIPRGRTVTFVDGQIHPMHVSAHAPHRDGRIRVRRNTRTGRGRY